MKNSVGVWQCIKADYEANKKNRRGAISLVLFRLAHCHAQVPCYLKPFTLVMIILYRFISECLLGFELHWATQVGPGVRLFHGFGLVVHSDAKIGRNVTLRHGITIGTKEFPDGTQSRAPRIGNNVNIGASALIIGDIIVGDNAIIGAGAVVTKDVPPMAVVVGNPARIL